MVQDPSIFSIIDWRAYFVMILFWFCLLFFVFYTSVSDSYLFFIPVPMILNYKCLARFEILKLPKVIQSSDMSNLIAGEVFGNCML